ncbi:hypothetical protein OH492_12695 [Vibrio chagasii]|nr:hypothetical protein [Vibrio chagasii]
MAKKNWCFGVRNGCLVTMVIQVLRRFKGDNPLSSSRSPGLDLQQSGFVMKLSLSVHQ